MPRGFFFFEQRDSGRASKIVTLAGPFLQAVAHALQTESEVGSEDQGLFNEDQVHGCAKLPLGDCGIRRTMDKAAEREEILQSAIAGVRRVAQAIAALPEGTRSAPSRPRNAATSRRCAIWSILMTLLARGCRR